MTEDSFHSEQESLLLRMATQQRPNELWPQGCYGSQLAWLTFVGPSPGGRNRDASEIPRQAQVEIPLWNEDYTDPLRNWSRGFRISMGILVETILARRQEQGALRLYNFANFDWIQNPSARNVPEDRMRRGKEVVLNHLANVQPRVIVTMESRAHQLLAESLREQYVLRCQTFGKIEILIGNTRGAPCYHRHLEAYIIQGRGILSGRIVLRCPQHPAWIRDADYAGRLSRALRQVLVRIWNGEAAISIEER